MKQYLIATSIFFTASLSGLDIGAGFCWNTIDETFHSHIFSNEDRSGKDCYEASVNRLAPLIQVGHQFYSCNGWSFGGVLEWKYLDYSTPNMGSSRGQILPNASFSSINFFGPEVIREFTSITKLQNEVLLLGVLGRQVYNGYCYLGVGPVFLNGSNSLYVTSVHIPNGVGDHLISTSATSRQSIWGGAARLGYQWCCFNISYTYMQSGSFDFNDTENAAILNGAVNPGPTTLFLNRSIQCTSQELALSIHYSY